MTKKANENNIAIIGAGPAGLTAGYLLAKEGYKVDLYESSSSVGGMCKTLDLWGQRVDIGPHRFFSKNTQVNELWLDMVGDDYEKIDRLTRIFYKNKFYYYPIKPFNALANLGFIEAFKCVVDYVKEKAKEDVAAESFEDWVISRFGRRLYEHFFKSYSEKLWGIKCSELSTEFAEQRIKKLSLSEAIFSAFKPKGNTKHKTLLEEFLHPKGGIGLVYDNMAKKIENLGGTILTNNAITQILVEKNSVKGIKTLDETVAYYDHVISTMPITMLIKGLNNVPDNVVTVAKNLVFRNTYLVYVEVDNSDLFPDQWIYVHTPEIEIGRITNFRNWTKQMHGNSSTTILALEIWCNDEDEIWKKSDLEVADIAEDNLKHTNLIGHNKILNKMVYRIPRSYPVYKVGYREQLKILEAYIDTIQNLHAIGRGGAFKYNNQDHSILMGILLAENISKNKNHNLWQVNNDYEYQEE